MAHSKRHDITSLSPPGEEDSVAGDERGASSVEFAIVFILVLILTFGIVEMALVLQQWNAADTATQLGVRRAVVSAPVAPNLTGFDGKGGALADGAPCTRGDGTVENVCFPGGNPVTCTSGGCTGFGYSGAAFTAILTEMRRALPRIQPANVQVEYRYVGLGFVGRPGGLPPIVTVRLTGMTYDMIVLDRLVGIAKGMSMPPIAASLPGEDLSNTTP
ncbi:MAG: pilus assembly protein [Rhodospirillales bacterium]|nr:pilus assembly protein [Rhodospirillales bacterium]